MKKYIIYLFSALLLSTFCLSATLVNAGGKKPHIEKVWSHWELSPVADIYYRVEILPDAIEASNSKSISIEFLNNYKKDVSFCFAINDNGTPAVSYQPVFNLKKKKTAVFEYPRPTETKDFKVNIVSVQLSK